MKQKYSIKNICKTERKYSIIEKSGIKKKYKNICLVLALCSIYTCAGCADRESAPNPEQAEAPADREAVAEGNMPESSQESSSETFTEPRELTAEELAQFTDFVNRADNYGFLLSQYTRAGEVDLNEVLYNGAGMEVQPLSESEQKAYEAAGYSIETDITRLTGEQIEDFLRRKMGIGLDDVAGGLDWVYLEGSDCYVFQHGDTNYCSFTCAGGRQTEEDRYEIVCRTQEAYVQDCVVTLRKTGDDYQFVSNRAADAEEGTAAEKSEGQDTLPGQTEEQEPDLSALEEGVRKQLEVFAEAKDQWNMTDYDPFTFYYTVYDLDGDGALELVTQVTAGTGLFSENHFYRVNASGDGIEELEQEYYAEYAELDIGVSSAGQQAFLDREDATIYYPASDWTKNGYAEADCVDGAYYLKDGRVYSIAFRDMYRQSKDGESFEETYYDMNGSQISREAWEGLYEDFCRDKEEISCTISWISAYPEDVEKASAQEILREMAEIL